MATLDPNGPGVPPDPVTPSTISPKVSYPFWALIILTGVAAALAAITPEMLGGLGAFAVPTSIGLAAIAQGLIGWLKTDPARWVTDGHDEGDPPRHRAEG